MFRSTLIFLSSISCALATERISEAQLQQLITPTTVFAEYAKNSYLLTQDDIPAQIHYLKVLLSQNPKQSDAEFSLALLYDRIGNDAQAITHYRHALTLNPDHYKAHNNLGRLLIDRGKFKEAITHLTDAITINSQESTPYYNRGIAYDRLKQFNNAIKDYTAALHLDPNNTNIYNYRGNAYVLSKQDDKAVEDYTHAIKIDPQNIGAYYNRALLNTFHKHYPQVLADYTHILELEPDNAKIYYQRGTINELLQNYPAAIADYTRVITLNPQDTDAYLDRAWIYYYHEQQYDLAIADLNQVIALNPNNASAFNMLGVVHNDMGYYELATQDYQQAITIDENYILPYLNLLELQLIHSTMKKELITKFYQHATANEPYIMIMDMLQLLDDITKGKDVNTEKFMQKYQRMTLPNWDFSPLINWAYSHPEREKILKTITLIQTLK